MNLIKKLFNIKILSLLFVIYYTLATAELYFFPEQINYMVPFNISPLAFFLYVIFVPITEELIFRYWVYGRNIKLQFSFFITFVLYLIIDIYQTFITNIFNFTNNINIDGMILNSFMLFVGIILYYIIIFSNFNIPVNFTKLVHLKYNFIIQVLIFAFIHIYGPDIFNFHLSEYFNYFVLSFLITSFARKFGIYLSIILHILINAIATISDVVFVRNSAKSLVSDQLLYSYLFITIIIMMISFICIFKVKKINEELKISNKL